MKISNEKLELAMANECITRNELAKKSGVAKITLTKKKTNPNIKPVTVGKIAKALKIKVEDLIE